MYKLRRRASAGRALFFFVKKLLIVAISSLQNPVIDIIYMGIVEIDEGVIKILEFQKVTLAQKPLFES